MKNMYKKHYHKDGYIKYYDKNNKIDYKEVLTVAGLEELCRRKNISNNNISRDIKNTFEYYGLNSDFILVDSYQDGKKYYMIPLVSEDILALMIENSRNNKMKNKNQENLTKDEFIEHNEKIFKLIEDLPRGIKNEIKNTETYKKNLEINQLLCMLTDRLNLFFNICISDTNVNEAGDIMRSLITLLDKFLYNRAYNEVEIEELEQELNMQIRKKEGSNYLLETLLKDYFLKSIEKNIEILDFIKRESISLEEIKKKLENIAEINKEYGLENSDSENLKILYTCLIAKMDERECIKRYMLKLKKLEENINKKNEEIDYLKNEGRYILNNIDNGYILGKEYVKYRNVFMDLIFSVDEKIKKNSNFYKEYCYNWENSELLKDEFIYLIFKKYPSMKRFYLKKDWKRFIEMLMRKTFLILLEEEIFLDEYGEFDIEIYSKYVKEYKELKYPKSIELENTIENIEDKINNFLEDLYTLPWTMDMKAIERLKLMYKNQVEKDQEAISNRKDLMRLNDKIKTIEEEIKKYKGETKELLKKDLEKELKKKINLEKKIYQIKDLRNTIDIALGKVFITSLYMDQYNLNNKTIGLEKYIDSIGKNNKLEKYYI